MADDKSFVKSLEQAVRLAKERLARLEKTVNEWRIMADRNEPIPADEALRQLMEDLDQMAGIEEEDNYLFADPFGEDDEEDRPVSLNHPFGEGVSG